MAACLILPTDINRVRSVCRCLLSHRQHSAGQVELDLGGRFLVRQCVRSLRPRPSLLQDNYTNGGYESSSLRILRTFELLPKPSPVCQIAQLPTVNGRSYH